MNIKIFIIAIIFWLEETSYFGWNLGAKSNEELLCDWLALLILSLAFQKRA
jgi:hypothetical protein